MAMLTKPLRSNEVKVLTGNEFMKRDLGIGAYHKESHGAIFDKNRFEDALKEF
jgi:hypothetical protein